MIDQPISTARPTPEPVPQTPPEAASEPAPTLTAAPAASARADLAAWQAVLGLALILLIGAYFRFTGLNWDSGQYPERDWKSLQHLHPDERFMANVANDIRPVENIFDYFNPEKSSLNPFRTGSYTYGMFPMFLTRYTAERLKSIGEWAAGEGVPGFIARPIADLELARITEYGKLTLVGRALSGLFDLAAVAMLFFLGARLYNRRVGLLASALYTAAVLPIQLSHYFTVDSFATIFIIAAIYVAAPLMDKGGLWSYALFGLLTGLAMACKINTAPLAGLIVLAGGVRLIKGWRAAENRKELAKQVLLGWLIAGLVTAVALRVFQPYAFNGPGFFGLSLNQRWLDIMREVTDQVAGKSEWPPNHHWTNRDQLTFAWIQNTGWGLGLPLGIVATLGWLWAAWRTWRNASFEPDANREWQGHLLLVVWVGAYFAWQNAQFWRYMRYFMPAYPLAALLAAWALIELVDRAMALKTRTIREVRQTSLLRMGAIGLLAAVTLATQAYAWAFTRIYARPHSRVEASWWMLANIPGPLNLKITAPDGALNTQPLAVPYDLVLKPDEGFWRTPFEPVTAGTINQIESFQLYAPDTEVRIKIARNSEGADIAAEGKAIIPASPDTAEHPAAVLLNAPITLAGGQTYFLHYTVRASGGFVGRDLSLADDREVSMTLGGELNAAGTDEVNGIISFTPDKEITLDRLNIGAAQITYPETTSTVRLTLSRDSEGNDKLAVSEITVNLLETASPRSFSFEPVAVETGQSYFVTLEVPSGSPIRPAGATLAMETSWDDSLPLRVGKYDPLGGIYRTTNLEVFERDNAIKRDRIVDALARSDYLVLSSNRGYDAMPRLPLRYPLTLKYYQTLFNCAEQFIIHCAYPAEVGLKGPLGYELIAVFESNPTLGPFEFSDQYAEEAFTVYDHPKVMIFKRAAEYSSENLLETLNTVDLTQVLEQTPIHYTAMPTALKLPSDRLAAQTEAGTWSELFDRDSLLNYYQSYGVAAWYLLIVFMGVTAWPIVFVVMRGLPDHGYPVAKLIGLLIITWVAWFTGSYKVVPFTSPALWFILTVFLFFSGFIAYRNLTDIGAFVKEKWNYILLVEAITLALFLYFLWVRWLNPDLWHPWLGGEKPADYSFFQSAIRSVYFPPYDPWLSGHYVNYYYYGYVIAAVPTKMLGIVPSIAYNLVLPTLFAFAGIGAFCAAYNLVAAETDKPEPVTPPDPTTEEDSPATTGVQTPALRNRHPLIAGLAAMVMMVLLGNLYQIRQLWRYLPEVADPPASYSEDWITNALNVASGAARVISGDVELPGDKGRWYFGPSRAILHDGPDTPITEFPYFSFLYADLHPHLSSMSIMLAALAWMISVVFASQIPTNAESTDSKRRWPGVETALGWFVGGLLIGALQPTHTWDFPGFVLLGVFAVVAAVWLRERALSRSVLTTMLRDAVLLFGLAVVMYYPFRQWFATDFTSIEYWKFTRTPLADYFTVHGLFLFIILTLLVWKLWGLTKVIPKEYLLNTPLGELLPQIKMRIILIGGSLLLLGVGTVLLWRNDYASVWLALLLLAGSAVLFFKPDQTLPRRAWLTIFAAGVGLTIVVELINLRGDLGRSNSVFKYYIEVWLFFSVAAGAALAWLLPGVVREWSSRLRRGWLSGLALLAAGAASYTLIATQAKTTDRWPGIETPPHTVDGNAYMLGSDQEGVTGQDRQSAAYDDEGSPYVLVYDYNAIQWLQNNAIGTPVIVEGTSPLYRWGSRIAINTGLPTVVGWDWHLKQHDSIIPPVLIDNRINDVREFYDTTDAAIATAFLTRYNVRYIVVGGLERKYYAAEGLAKFTAMVDNGELTRVYPIVHPAEPDEATYLYEVAGKEN